MHLFCGHSRNDVQGCPLDWLRMMNRFQFFQSDNWWHKIMHFSFLIPPLSAVVAKYELIFFLFVVIDMPLILNFWRLHVLFRHIHSLFITRSSAAPLVAAMTAASKLRLFSSNNVSIKVANFAEFWPRSSGNLPYRRPTSPTYRLWPISTLWFFSIYVTCSLIR